MCDLPVISLLLVRSGSREQLLPERALIFLFLCLPLSRRPSSLHSRASGLIMHDRVALFCFVRGQKQWGCKIYPASGLQKEVNARSCMTNALKVPHDNKLKQVRFE